ncbi:MAG TPA: TfoX/Sxy family protein [Solirubrobacterales bacterium]|nr:TfoX/Sxy family protein [Solirubrobacterales bacterium]
MAYDEELAERVRDVLALRDDLVERRMFGGIAFLLAGNMACGALGDELIVRVGPQEYGRAQSEPHTRPFDFTGRPMKGFVVVSPQGIEADDALAAWVEAGADFAASLPPK